MKKRVKRTFLYALCMMLILVGCGSITQEEEPEEVVMDRKDEEKQEEEDQGEKNIVLNTVSMFGENHPIAPLYDEAIKSFEENNYGVVVKDYSADPTEQWRINVRARSEVGEMPDVIFAFTGDAIETVIAKEELVTIDEIRESYPGYVNVIDEEILKLAATTDGEMYSVPIQMFVTGVYCNEELFEEYDLKIPSDWEELIEAAEVFVENDIIPIAVAFEERVEYLVESLILSKGGVEASNREQVLQARAVWISVLEDILWLSEYYRENGYILGHSEAINKFINKEAAMIIEGDWNSELSKEEGVIFIPVPKVNKTDDLTEVITELTGGFYITRAAWEDLEKREYAVTFIDSFVRGSRMDQIVSLTGGSTTRTETTTKNNAVVNVKSPRNDVGTDVWEYTIESIPSLINGDKEIEEVVSEITYRYWDFIQSK